MTGDSPDNFDATRTSIGAVTLLKKDRLLANRYRVLGPIGAGGMGLVYRAFDERLKLEVALKVLRAERAPDQAMLERFEREIVLAREVSHPNVVRIHDIGQDGELDFITMDLVSGQSLRQIIENDGPLETHRAARIAADIAEGLYAAHEKGVIHRDLKPGNILLDENDKAYISDFGVARSLHTSSMTQTGMIVGSPDYLAPEQARGDDIDGRSDIYALGLILYEMLSGELPFRSGTIEELIAQRTVGQPREISKTGAKVPAWLRRIIYKCLQKDPARRYINAAELAQDLRQHNAPAFALPRPTRRTVGLGSMVVGLAVMAFLWQWISSRPAAELSALRVAVLPLINESGNDSLQWMATGMSDLLDTQFSESADIEVIETARVVETLADLRLNSDELDERNTPQLAELLGADQLLTGAIRATDAQVRIDARLLSRDGSQRLPISADAQLENPRRLVELLASNLRTALSVSAPLDDAPVLSTSTEALLAYSDGRAALTRGDINTATLELELAVTTDPGFAAAWFHLARAYDMAGRDDDALTAARNAVEQSGAESSRARLRARAFAAALERDYEGSQTMLQELITSFPSDISARMALAEAYGNEGRFEEANAILKEVVKADTNHPRAWFLLGKYAIQSGDNRRAVNEYLVRDLVVQNRLGSARGKANALNAMGIAYGRLQQFDEARSNYEEAAEIRRQVNDKRGTATSLNNLATLEMMAGNFDAARANLEDAKQLSRELGDQAGLAAFINTLGTVEEETGNYTAALDEYRDALNIRETLGDRRALTESYTNVGFAYFVLGQLDNARIYWERALDESRELGNIDGEMQVLQSLGQLYTARADWSAATKAFLRALEISREIQYPEAEAISLGNLGNIAALQGRSVAAFSQFEEALAILEPVGDNRGMVEFGLKKARELARFGLDKQATDQLDKIDTLLKDAPNLGQRSEMLRLRAEISDQGATVTQLLNDAIQSSDASGSVVAALQVQLTAAQVALNAGNFDEAIQISRQLARQAARAGYVPLELEARETLIRALLAHEGASGARTEVHALLKQLDAHQPYVNSFRMRSLASEVLAESGNDKEALVQQRAAAIEVLRVRDNLPEMALSYFESLPEVSNLKEESLVNGD